MLKRLEENKTLRTIVSIVLLLFFLPVLYQYVGATFNLGRYLGTLAHLAEEGICCL